MMTGICGCSEEYGPCEDHGVVLCLREGASARTADELAMVNIGDAIGLGVVPTDGQSSAIERLGAALDASRSPSSGCAWFDNPDDSGEAYELADSITAALYGVVPNCYVADDDGRVVWQIVGGPLKGEA